MWRYRQQSVDILTIRNCTESLRHRGPDDEGYVLINSRSSAWAAFRGEKTDARLHLPVLNVCTEYDDYDIALGQTRLSILDLSPAGHQPMSSPDGRFHLTFNGEIYNFQEIRCELQSLGYTFQTGTDTEVVLHAYQEWDTECLNRFNGMWAFALWDSDKRRMFVARDRFGVKPLVYHTSAGYFACASEIKALLFDPEISRELDPQALHHYLSLMTVSAPFTIYKSIRKLLPGHYILVDNSGMQVFRYWSLQDGELENVNETQAIEQLDSLLQDAVRLRLISDVPVGAFLSGGVDSSVVSALAARQNGGTGLRTFSIGFRGLDQFDESGWAAKVASHIGSQHTCYELSLEILQVLSEFSQLMDEPFASSSVLGVYLLAREASQQVKVVLTGDGGDEVFVGYWSRHAGIDQTWDRFQRRPLGWLRASSSVNGWAPVSWQNENVFQRVFRRWQWQHLSDQTVRDRWYIRSIAWAATDPEKYALYTPDWVDQVGKADTEEWLLGQFSPVANDRLRRWQLFDIHTTLADEMLAKIDKATMAWGLEARTPLLDYRVVQYAISLPASFKVRGEQGKYLLKKLGEKYIPLDILYRPKQGFTVPLAVWFYKELRDFVQEVLAEERLHRQGIFRSKIVRMIVERCLAEPTVEYTTLVFNLVCFQLWFQNQAAYAI